MTIPVMLAIVRESVRCESYEDAQQILKDHLRIETNDDTMRKVTNCIGTLVYNNDVNNSDTTWDELKSGCLQVPKSKKNAILYIEVDGAMLPTRQEGQKGVVYRENKLGMIFSSDNIHWWTDKNNKRQHRILKREYVTLIGNSEDFTKLLFSKAVKNGYMRYDKVVLLSDGATWIRNMKDLVFPDSHQILDFFHLKEHVSDLLKQIIYDDEIKNKILLDEISKLFKESKYEDAIDILIRLAKNNFKDQLNNFINYISNNKDNIDYLKYRQNNFFIGSSAIESANTIVLQRRMKYGAMRWNLYSGQAVVSLVAKARSGLWGSDVVDAVYSRYGEPLKDLKSFIA
jgi:hypothetical protein